MTTITPYQAAQARRDLSAYLRLRRQMQNPRLRIPQQTIAHPDAPVELRYALKPEQPKLVEGGQGRTMGELYGYATVLVLSALGIVGVAVACAVGAMVRGGGR